MKAEKRTELMQDYLLFRQADRFQAAANLNKDWPSGRAVFINNQKTLLIWVGEEDHIRIISMQRGNDIIEAFKRICNAA